VAPAYGTSTPIEAALLDKMTQMQTNMTQMQTNMIQMQEMLQDVCTRDAARTREFDAVQQAWEQRDASFAVLFKDLSMAVSAITDEVRQNQAKSQEAIQALAQQLDVNKRALNTRMDELETSANQHRQERTSNVQKIVQACVATDAVAPLAKLKEQVDSLRAAQKDALTRAKQANELQVAQLREDFTDKITALDPTAIAAQLAELRALPERCDKVQQMLDGFGPAHEHLVHAFTQQIQDKATVAQAELAQLVCDVGVVRDHAEASAQQADL